MPNSRSLPWIAVPSEAEVDDFTPDELSGLQVWLKADAIVGKVDGDTVTTWSDSSGGGHDFTEATNRPLYKTNIQNSLPAVRFDGVNDLLSGGNLGALWPSAVTAVIVYAADPTGPNTSNMFSHSTVDQWWHYNDRQAYMGMFRTARLTGFPKVRGLASGASQMTIISSAARYDYYRDGVLCDSGTPSYSAGTSMVLGNGESRPAKVDIFEVIIYNSALSDVDRARVESYVATKWGMNRTASSGTPTSISGCRLWLRADAITGKVDTDPVYLWRDESGYARDFEVYNSLTVAPAYRTNIQNGLPSVRFDEGDFMDAGNLNSDFPSAATLFLVAYPRADTEYTAFANVNNDAWTHHSSGNGFEGAFRTPRVETYLSPGPGLNNPFIYTVKSSAVAYEVYKNGTSGGVKAAGYPTSGQFYFSWTLGCMIDTNRTLKGDIFEVILYDTALGDTDRGTIESYLNAKWAIF